MEWVAVVAGVGWVARRATARRVSSVGGRACHSTRLRHPAICTTTRLHLVLKPDTHDITLLRATCLRCRNNTTSCKLKAYSYKVIIMTSNILLIYDGFEKTLM